MTLRRVAAAVLALAVVVVMAACGQESYENRMKHLDYMTEAGITYRRELLRQGTPISEEACDTGHTLLDANVPSDGDGMASRGWRAQSKEAYMKGCLTGSPRPKPDPSGVDAVTPVPHGSAPGESASPAPAGSGSP